MTTLGDLKQEIADDLERSDLSASIQKEILAAIRHFEEERFYFSESRAETFNTVADEPDYDSEDLSSLPDFTKINGIYATVNSTARMLTPLTSKAMELERGDRTGAPTHYSLINDVLTLYPTPDDAYQIRILGFTRLAALSGDDATNAWMTEAYDLIRARAAAKVCAFKIRDLEAASTYQLLEDRELMRLRAQTERKRVSGDILGSGL